MSDDPMQNALNETFEALREILSSEHVLSDAMRDVEAAVDADDLAAFKRAMESMYAARAAITQSQRRTLEAVMRLQMETVLMENDLEKLLSEEFFKGIAEGLRTAPSNALEPQSLFTDE
ncbi:hypothetical protein FBQ95_16925 [Chloroflexi bacterium CFX3]|nr:hypothetical protein [Chloroflexi bacterium CFX3]